MVVSRMEVQPTKPFGDLLKLWCVLHGGGRAPASVKFEFDGDTIMAHQTPESLGMEDGDVVDVYLDILTAGGKRARPASLEDEVAALQKQKSEVDAALLAKTAALAAERAREKAAAEAAAGAAAELSATRAALETAQREGRRAAGLDLAGLDSAQLDALEGRAKESLRRVQKAASASDSVCVICYDRPKAVAFSPCMHRACCEQCANVPAECPLCRATIAERKRVYG